MDYRTGNLLNYEYFSKHFKLFSIDLSKQIELENLIKSNKLILLVELMKILLLCSLSLKNKKEQLLILTKFYNRCLIWFS